MNGMLYYLLSSLPSENTNQPQGIFYGLSPGGLARGALLMDYQGKQVLLGIIILYNTVLYKNAKITNNHFF